MFIRVWAKCALPAVTSQVLQLNAPLKVHDGASTPDGEGSEGRGKESDGRHKQLGQEGTLYNHSPSIH
jgi:hypothetical protein